MDSVAARKVDVSTKAISAMMFRMAPAYTVGLTALITKATSGMVAERARGSLRKVMETALRGTLLTTNTTAGVDICLRMERFMTVASRMVRSLAKVFGEA